MSLWSGNPDPKPIVCGSPYRRGLAVSNICTTWRADFSASLLDTGLLALVDHRTAVLSNGCTQKGADMGRRTAKGHETPPIRLTRRGRIVVFCSLLSLTGGAVAL